MIRQSWANIFTTDPGTESDARTERVQNGFLKPANMTTETVKALSTVYDGGTRNACSDFLKPQQCMHIAPSLMFAGERDEMLTHSPKHVPIDVPFIFLQHFVQNAVFTRL